MSSKVPKLRFYGFSGEWEENNESIKIISGNNYPLSSYDKEGVLLIQGLNINPNKLKLDKPIYISSKYQTNNHIIIKKNDILIGLNRPIIDNKLKICLFNEEKAYLYQRAGLLSFSTDKLENKFLYYYLSSNIFLKQLLLELVGSDQPYIKSNLFKKTKNIFPNNIKEQQKIANCLSSLDNLIESQNKKVKALEKHKKGLMQNLFPQDADKEPKLRFDGFSGEWEEKKLSSISKITTGSSNREDSTNSDGDYTFFDRSEDIRTSHRYLFDDEAIIVAGEGSEFKPKYFNGKFDLHQRTYAILNLNIIGKFLYFYIYKHRNYFLDNAVGSTVKSLRLPMFEQMPILLPTLPEQKKIADTLSSLDNLIAEQNKKIETLKKHKKGLMQQLFVNSED